MTAPEVFCQHLCGRCDKVAIVDAKLPLPEGWSRTFDRDDDLVELCDECAKVCADCGRRYDPDLSFYNEQNRCPSCGDARYDDADCPDCDSQH